MKVLQPVARDQAVRLTFSILVVKVLQALDEGWGRGFNPDEGSRPAVMFPRGSTSLKECLREERCDAIWTPFSRRLEHRKVDVTIGGRDGQIPMVVAVRQGHLPIDVGEGVLEGMLGTLLCALFEV